MRSLTPFPINDFIYDVLLWKSLLYTIFDELHLTETGSEQRPYIASLTLQDVQRMGLDLNYISPIKCTDKDYTDNPKIINFAPNNMFQATPDNKKEVEYFNGIPTTDLAELLYHLDMHEQMHTYRRIYDDFYIRDG